MQYQSNGHSRILMADDDDDYYLIAKEVMEDLGLGDYFYRVADGEELMDYLLFRNQYQNPASAPKPSLLFLDLNMPRKSGMEALKEMRANPELRRIPIVIFTVSRDKKDIDQCYLLGANSFVTKPPTFDAFSQVFKTMKEYWLKTVALPS